MDPALIVSFRKTFNFYKEPEEIGEIIEYQKEEYLIIGIERAKFTGKKLEILYTCQNLNMMHALPPKVTGFDKNVTEFYVDIDTVKHFSDSDWMFSSRTKNIIPLGEVFNHEDHYYRWLNYIDLSFNFTTLRVSGLAEPVHPVSVKEARKTLINHKKKKLDISVIK